MAISKRLRFEILQRDDNTCQYCGGRAPDVVLTVDHVVPTTLGGSDDPANLVAACKDCNAGKSSRSPDAVTVAKVSDDAARWADAMRLAAERLNANKTAATEQMQPFFDAWFMWSGPGWRYRLPGDADAVLTNYLAAGMPPETLGEAAQIALRKKGVENYWHYFQGVAKNMLADLQRDAAAILSAQQSNEAAPESDEEFGWHNRAWKKGYLRALDHIGRAENGDPLYRHMDALPTSVFQYGALALLVDHQALDWSAAL